jgi:protein subunit release factor A
MMEQAMQIEKRQSKLQANTEATERWQRKLFRAANELQKLAKERKRLLGPKKPTEVKYRSLEDIRMACGGSEFNDEIPI